MPVRLENLTDRPVLLTLAGGDALRLSPGEVSGELAEVDVTSSPRADKLIAARVLAVTGLSTESTGTDEDTEDDAGEGADPGKRPARRSTRRSARSSRETSDQDPEGSPAEVTAAETEENDA